MGRVNGKWHGEPFHDFKAKKWLITFETDQKPEVFDDLRDKDLIIEIKEHKKGRSLNANAYFHKLVDLISEKLRSSHVEIHNLMIARYGQPDDEIKNIIMADRIPWDKLDTIHLRPTLATRTLDDGELYRVYIVMRGSHTYDTKEMARLIDGVVSEAKDLGIETLPPQEIERMKQQWLRK